VLEKVAIVTLGCPKNEVDSEIMSGLLSERFALVDDPQEADVIVVNTCTFINQAKQESIDTILELAQLKERGNAKVLIAAGCLAQRYGRELLTEIPELDGVIGTGNFDEIAVFVDDLLKTGKPVNKIRIKKGKPNFTYADALPRRRQTPHYLGYVKIAEGCDNCCTYCVIPQVRGSFRSRPEESIVNEVRRMAAEGVKEILLMAQDTTRYGLDLYGEFKLPQLIRKLAKVEGIEWIRLMYCYPDNFTDELIETMAAEPKVCRYVDLPLQHADNRILREMNRRGTIEEAEALIGKLRQAMPDITIRTTFITGFPGETEEAFKTLLEFVSRVKFDRLGAFAYSQEENTPAARRPDQVPLKVREERREILLALQYEIALERQQRWLGKTVRVIAEEAMDDGRIDGRSEGDAPEIDGQVYFHAKDIPVRPGDIVKVKVNQADSYDLMGEVVS